MDEPIIINVWHDGLEQAFYEIGSLVHEQGFRLIGFDTEFAGVD